MTAPSLTLLFSQEQIAQKVQAFAKQIKQDYQNKDLVILMVLKGALCLVSDLMRQIELPFEIDFIKCSSYGPLGTRRGELEISGLDRLELRGRDVLIVDDIFDSGQTLASLKAALKEKGPRSVKSLVLLSKQVPHVNADRPEYVLFEIEDLFVVGYGLDYKEQYRGLPGIYILSL